MRSGTCRILKFSTNVYVPYFQCLLNSCILKIKNKIVVLEKTLNDILLSDEEDAKEIANSALEKIMFLDGF